MDDWNATHPPSDDPSLDAGGRYAVDSSPLAVADSAPIAVSLGGAQDPGAVTTLDELRRRVASIRARASDPRFSAGMDSIIGGPVRPAMEPPPSDSVKPLVAESAASPSWPEREAVAPAAGNPAAPPDFSLPLNGVADLIVAGDAADARAPSESASNSSERQSPGATATATDPVPESGDSLDSFGLIEPDAVATDAPAPIAAGGSADGNDAMAAVEQVADQAARLRAAVEAEAGANDAMDSAMQSTGDSGGVTVADEPAPEILANVAVPDFGALDPVGSDATASASSPRAVTGDSAPIRQADPPVAELAGIESAVVEAESALAAEPRAQIHIESGVFEAEHELAAESVDSSPEPPVADENHADMTAIGIELDDAAELTDDASDASVAVDDDVDIEAELPEIADAEMAVSRLEPDDAAEFADNVPGASVVAEDDVDIEAEMPEVIGARVAASDVDLDDAAEVAGEAADVSVAISADPEVESVAPQAEPGEVAAPGATSMAESMEGEGDPEADPANAVAEEEASIPDAVDVGDDAAAGTASPAMDIQPDEASAVDESEADEALAGAIANLGDDAGEDDEASASKADELDVDMAGVLDSMIAEDAATAAARPPQPSVSVARASTPTVDPTLEHAAGGMAAPSDASAGVGSGDLAAALDQMIADDALAGLGDPTDPVEAEDVSVDAGPEVDVSIADHVDDPEATSTLDDEISDPTESAAMRDDGGDALPAPIDAASSDPGDVDLAAALDAMISEEMDAGGHETDVMSAEADNDVVPDSDPAATDEVTPAELVDVAAEAGEGGDAVESDRAGAPGDSLAALGVGSLTGADRKAALKKVRAALAAKVKARSEQGDDGASDEDDSVGAMSAAQMAEMMTELDRALADGVDTLLDSSYDAIAGLLDSVFDEESILASPEVDLVPPEEEVDPLGDGTDVVGDEGMLSADDDGPSLAEDAAAEAAADDEAADDDATDDATDDAADDAATDAEAIVVEAAGDDVVAAEAADALEDAVHEERAPVPAGEPEAAEAEFVAPEAISPEPVEGFGDESRVPAGMQLDDGAELAESPDPAEDPLEAAAELAAVADLDADFDSVDLEEPEMFEAAPPVAAPAPAAASAPAATDDGAESPVATRWLRDRLEPLVRSILVTVNQPLRQVPPGWRTTVDWVALSLAFWIPVTWVLALILI